MGSTGLGLLLEEHRGEVVAAWRDRVQRELGAGEPALAFAVAPLLREMVFALGGEGSEQRSRDAWTRCAVLVRSTAGGAQLAREFKLLHRCIWEALRARGAPVTQSDRGALDEWLDDALAEALERLERVRLRTASFDRPPAARPIPPAARSIPPAARPSPPARPSAGPVARTSPPPLPARRGRPVVVAARPAVPADEPILEAEPLS